MIKKNQRFERWTVIEPNIYSIGKNKASFCECDCGELKTILNFTLRNGTSTQCNKCRLNKNHGQSKTCTYRIWMGIITRCYNENHKTYKYYGAKGIRISDEWLYFQKFVNDMGIRPPGYQIDRIDPTKGYNKENCRWISKKENTSRQNNRLINITGMKFGKWNVIDRDLTKAGRDQAYWNCICECGTKSSVIGSFLRKGKTKQCRDCKDDAHRGWGDRVKMKDRNNER